MTPHPEHSAAVDLAPDADRALAEFLEHLRLERGRSPHTVRAYRADLTGPARRPARAAGPRSRAAARVAGRRARRRSGAVHARPQGRRRAHVHGMGAPEGTASRRSRRPAGRPAAPIRPARPCSTASRPPRCSTRPAHGPGPTTRWRSGTGSSSSCSTPPGCGSPSSAGSTWTTSTSSAAPLRVVGKGDRERTVVYGVPAGRALRVWRDVGRPALARPGSPPALLLGARGGRLDPRVARGGGAPGRGGRPGRPRRRPARPSARGGDAHARRRRGPSLRTGVARSR